MKTYIGLLCRVGWHLWDKWSQPETVIMSGVIYKTEIERIAQRRFCLRCGKMQVRLI